MLHCSSTWDAYVAASCSDAVRLDLTSCQGDDILCQINSAVTVVARFRSPQKMTWLA